MSDENVGGLVELLRDALEKADAALSVAHEHPNDPWSKDASPRYEIGLALSALSAHGQPVVDDEMIERAAISVFAADSGSVEAWPKATNREREFCRRIARAVLTSAITGAASQ